MLEAEAGWYIYGYLRILLRRGKSHTFTSTSTSTSARGIQLQHHFTIFPYPSSAKHTSF
jgi:hypothetical protein